ncbi:uncharacterized protein [Primulina eburnea]|uniref:uncharacterized protein n=1 Tax=Primulina eburnea TaxID=1245227 RepID=UPI003C6C95FF
MGISPKVAEHKLNIIPGSRPVKQKKRHFGPEKDKIIEEQVKEMLKAGNIWKAQKFGWDEGCEQAFRDLKKHLAELPVLVKPELGEKLWVYLSATEHAVSSVLIKEEGIDQRPVYYVSDAFRGAELKYSEVEKIVLVLVVTARKLRPYFLSHPIVVLTNSHLGRIMTRENLRKNGQMENRAGRLVAQKIKGAYGAKDEKMLKYLKLITARAATFTDWSIEQIPREKNGEADNLAKLATSISEVSTWEIMCFTRLVLSIDEEIPPVQKSSWMTPIVEYIVHKKLPEDRAYAAKIIKQAPRYGIPRKLISDNGRQFQGKKITSWCQEMKIIQSFTLVAYPQANGKTKVTNRIIVQALKARLHGKGKDWVEDLSSVLWAYRTTPRSSTRKTPYSLVYGSEAVLPVEIGQSSTRIESYPSNNDQSRAAELDLVEEKRDRAAIRMEAYRSRVMKSYNKHVWPRNFQVGNLVMKKIKPIGDVGKLEARWEGPFKIIRKVSSGAAYYLEDSQGHSLKRPWSAFHLKKYYV